jgi:hypothetical protein
MNSAGWLRTGVVDSIQVGSYEVCGDSCPDWLAVARGSARGPIIRPRVGFEMKPGDFLKAIPSWDVPTFPLRP